MLSLHKISTLIVYFWFKFSQIFYKYLDVKLKVGAKCKRKKLKMLKVIKN